MGKIYGPLKFLDNMSGYSLAPMMSEGNAVSSVNMSTLTAWVKTIPSLTERLNNGKELECIAVISYPFIPVTGGYRCDISFDMKDGSTTQVVGSYSAPDITTLAADVLSATGITISQDITAMRGTRIFPTVIDYRYESKNVAKLYGSVNDQTKLIKKLYGSVDGQTKLIYQA